MVDTYLRMPSEFRRIMDSHKRESAVSGTSCRTRS